MQLIDQALADMGAPDPHLKSQVELDICPQFQYWRYSKQEPPPNLFPQPSKFSAAYIV